MVEGSGLWPLVYRYGWWSPFQRADLEEDYITMEPDGSIVRWRLALSLADQLDTDGTPAFEGSPAPQSAVAPHGTHAVRQRAARQQTVASRVDSVIVLYSRSGRKALGSI